MNIATKEQYEEYYSNLQGQACDLSYKLRGLAYLFSNFQPETHGSPMDERENMMGIAMLMEHIKEDATNLYRKLDLVERPTLQLSEEAYTACSINNKVYSTSPKSKERWKDKSIMEENQSH